MDYETAEASMDEIMGGKASPVQMGAFLTTMAMKEQDNQEITACAAGDESIVYACYMIRRMCWKSLEPAVTIQFALIFLQRLLW